MSNQALIKLESEFHTYRAVTDQKLEVLTKSLKRLEMILIGSAGSTIILLISLVMRG